MFGRKNGLNNEKLKDDKVPFYALFDLMTAFELEKDGKLNEAFEHIDDCSRKYPSLSKYFNKDFFMKFLAEQKNREQR